MPGGTQLMDPLFHGSSYLQENTDLATIADKIFHVVLGGCCSVLK